MTSRRLPTVRPTVDSYPSMKRPPSSRFLLQLFQNLSNDMPCLSLRAPTPYFTSTTTRLIFPLFLDKILATINGVEETYCGISNRIYSFINWYQVWNITTNKAAYIFDHSLQVPFGKTGLNIWLDPSLSRTPVCPMPRALTMGTL